MQNSQPKLILTFGCSDPMARLGLAADLTTFAAFECLGLPILTSYLIGDSTQIDEIIAIEMDHVDDQARTILEDTPVNAIKVGQIGSTANVGVIAEILSDYPDVPVILDPFHSALLSNMSEDEDLALAIRELLIPQAFLLVISQVALNRLIDTWAQVDGIPPQEDSDDLALSLIEHGCKYILVTDIAVANNNIQHVLFDESGNKTVFELERELTPININTQISAALAATLALQVEFSEAVEQALQFTIASAQQTIRIGMGNPAPNNYFWTQRDSRNTETSPTTALSPSE